MLSGARGLVTLLGPWMHSRSKDSIYVIIKKHAMTKWVMERRSLWLLLCFSLAIAVVKILDR